jgi:hypothetical protein
LKPGHSAYYTITFVIPTLLITSVGLFGKQNIVTSRSIPISGLFTPSANDQDRQERCTLGQTSLLTIAVILMIVANYVSRSNAAQYPKLGVFFFNLNWKYKLRINNYGKFIFYKIHRFIYVISNRIVLLRCVLVRDHYAFEQ